MLITSPHDPAAGAVARLGGPGPAALGLLALAAVVYALATSVVAWRRLRHIPGPPGAAWSRWWLLRNTLGGEMHLGLKRACEQYGECEQGSPFFLLFFFFVFSFFFFFFFFFVLSRRPVAYSKSSQASWYTESNSRDLPLSLPPMSLVASSSFFPHPA